VDDGLVNLAPTRQHVRVPQPTHLPEVWTQARALRDRGDLASARMLLEDSLDSATFQYGEDHPDILATALLLATLHRRAGDLSTARRVLEEALQAGSLRHDESEPVLLRISFELAAVADQLGNKHEARKHYGRVAAHGAGVEGLQDQVREAVAWLGPRTPPPPPAIPAQPHSPAPGVLAVQPPPGMQLAPQLTPPAQQPGLPQRVPQDRPVMAEPTPGAALAERTETLPAPRPHAPLPPLSGPVRYIPAPADEPMSLEPVAPPLPVAPPPSPVFTSAPSVIVEKRGRGAMVAAVAAALVAVMAAGVVVILLLGRGTTPSGPGPVTAESPQSPAAQHGPATNLTLSDKGDSITLRWTDPSGGSAGFAVKMGASKDTMKLVTGNLGAKPTFTITGLNAKFSYCFSVVTIYSGAEIYESASVCAVRGSAKAS
jgi:Tetratricopeptide repeat